MAEQRKSNTGPAGGIGDTGKRFSDIDASETESSATETSATETSTTGASKTSASTSEKNWQTGASPMTTGSTSAAGAACPTGASTTGSSQQAESASDAFSRQKQEAREQGREFKAAARQTAEQAKQKAADMAHEAKETARDMSDRAMHSAAETAQQVQQQAATFASGQKSRMASELSTFSEAISRAADKLREDHDERVASYADMAAQQLRSTANYLESRDMGDLMGDLEHFARRRPEVFFGGMLLVGLGLARFLKASSRPRQRSDYQGQQYPRAPMTQDRSFATSGDASGDASYYEDPSYDELSYAESSYSTGADLGAAAQRSSNAPRQSMNDPLSYH